MNLVLQKCVGNNLKLLRNYHGLSQQRMAESVDITRSLYVQYELGNRAPDAEVLFVAHHGSNTSTCKELLEAITPETAVISVGYNTYGHPTQKVLDRLAKYEITVLRTDTDGEITIAAGEG